MSKPPIYDGYTRYTIAIAQLLEYFNLLDTNVGLCLSFLNSPEAPEASYTQLASQTSQQRFEELKGKIESGIGHPQTVDPDEFAQWLSEADDLRTIRNRYIHGNWEYLPIRTDAPVGVRSPAWMRDKLGSNFEEKLTLEDLEGVASRAKRVFDQFMQIRKKHSI